MSDPDAVALAPPQDVDGDGLAASAAVRSPYFYSITELLDLAHSPAIVPPQLLNEVVLAPGASGPRPRARTGVPNSRGREHATHESSRGHRDRRDGQREGHRDGLGGQHQLEELEAEAQWDDPLADGDGFSAGGVFGGMGGESVAEFERWKQQQKADQLRKSGFDDADGEAAPTSADDGLGWDAPSESPDPASAAGQNTTASSSTSSVAAKRQTLDLWDTPLRSLSSGAGAGAGAGGSRFSSFLGPQAQQSSQFADASRLGRAAPALPSQLAHQHSGNHSSPQGIHASYGGLPGGHPGAHLRAQGAGVAPPPGFGGVPLGSRYQEPQHTTAQHQQQQQQQQHVGPPPGFGPTGSFQGQRPALYANEQPLPRQSHQQSTHQQSQHAQYQHPQQQPQSQHHQHQQAHQQSQQHPQYPSQQYLQQPPTHAHPHAEHLLRQHTQQPQQFAGYPEHRGPQPHSQPRQGVSVAGPANHQPEPHAGSTPSQRQSAPQQGSQRLEGSQSSGARAPSQPAAKASSDDAFFNSLLGKVASGKKKSGADAAQDLLAQLQGPGAHAQTPPPGAAGAGPTRGAPPPGFHGASGPSHGAADLYAYPQGPPGLVPGSPGPGAQHARPRGEPAYGAGAPPPGFGPRQPAGNAPPGLGGRHK